MRAFKRLGVLCLWSAVLAAGHNTRHGQFHANKRNTTTATTEYDYIVVGSGPGGGPLAARLAIAGYKVLLIDAGDDQTNATVQQVPALQLQSTEYEGTAWSYFVQHYENLTYQEQDTKMTYMTPSGEYHVGPNPPFGSQPLGILYPRAGTLGGCAAHNAMITVYPYEKDWQNLADITGNSSWSPDHMRTYFERLERNEYLSTSVVGHGYDGWLSTSLTQLTLVAEDKKILSLVLAACSAAGVPLGLFSNLLGGVLDSITSIVTGLNGILIKDMNSDVPNRDSITGAFQVPIAVDLPNYARSGPQEFVKNTSTATNLDGSRKYILDIQLNTLVTKIRFDTSGSTPKAIGVDYLQGQSLYRADLRSGTASPGIPGSVNATREVIISAGAFNSPQLLKLSGIGPKAELEAWGIPVVVDLPGVGTNMQDRYEMTVVGESSSDFVLTQDCTFGYSEPDPCLQDWQDTLPGGKEFVTYTTNGIALAVIQNSTTSDGDPDLFIAGAPADFRGYYLNYSRDAVRDARHWSWIVLKSQSRNTAGTVTLRSTDPQDTPIINFNSFYAGTTANNAAADDLQAVYEGMMFSRKAFADVNPLLGGAFTEVYPGPQVTGDALREVIQTEAWGHHACCTNRIGADSDPMAVLDSDFRVRGVSGLRVVDASAFPKIPGYYIVLPTYMLSEKAADVILADAV